MTTVRVGWAWMNGELGVFISRAVAKEMLDGGIREDFELHRHGMDAASAEIMDRWLDAVEDLVANP